MFESNTYCKLYCDRHMCQVEAFTKDTSVRICETNQPDRLNEACFNTVLPATAKIPSFILFGEACCSCWQAAEQTLSHFCHLGLESVEGSISTKSIVKMDNPCMNICVMFQTPTLNAICACHTVSCFAPAGAPENVPLSDKKLCHSS